VIVDERDHRLNGRSSSAWAKYADALRRISLAWRSSRFSRDQSTLWPIAAGGEENAATVHGTQKPVECMRRPILNNSAAGEAIYDPFLGSGTTLIAAETTGRHCLALDIDPRYVDVAVQRWQRMTGQTAVLAGEDRGFDDVAVARGVALAA
jgi:DNA modification methylase